MKKRMSSLVTHLSATRRRCPNLVWNGLRRRYSSSTTTAYKSLLPAKQPYRKWLWLTMGLSAYGGYRSIQIVETGQLGVVEILGVVQDELLKPGHHVVLPWAKVTKFNLQQRQVEINTKARIKGGLFIEMEVLILYKLDPNKIKDIYVQAGTLKDQQNWHLESVARSVLHAAAARRSMEQMHDTQQLEVGKEVQSKLAQLYQKEGVIVEQVVFRRVQLPDYLVTAIQDLHQLDLDINAEKRVVDGKLAVARGTAAARSILKGDKQPVKSPSTVTTPTTISKPIKPVAQKVKSNATTTITKESTNAKHIEKQAEEEKEKTLLERFLPYFYADSKDGNSNKKLPTLTAYTRQVKEDRKSYFPSFFAKEGKAKELMESVKQEEEGLKRTNKESNPKEAAEFSKTIDKSNKVEEAKIPTLKIENKENLKKTELELQEATSKGKGRGKTEKES